MRCQTNSTKLLKTKDCERINMKKKKTIKKVPNPGSPEAVEAGCLCPVLDNHYGKGVGAGKRDASLFWYSDACPVHHPDKK